MRTAQNKKRSRARSEEQQAQRQASIEKVHQVYLDVAQRYLDKARETLATIEQREFANELDVIRKIEIEGFMRHAARQID